MKQFVADKLCKLSDCLYERCNISYNVVKTLLRKKDVKVNGVRVKEDVTLFKGDEVIVYVKDEQYKVLYSDDNIIAFYKPKGVLSQGENSLDSAVNTDGKLFLMHRLDRGTDGILLFAKNRKSYDELYAAFKFRYLKKYYSALVWGDPPSEQGTVTSYLIKDEKTGYVKASLSVNGGEKALTKYKVIKREGELSLLEIELLTGKTHQIRASLPLLGLYIVGDEKYGKKEINEKYSKRKQQLTFCKLCFDLPEDFKLKYLNDLVIEL